MSIRRLLTTATISLLTASGCASWFAPKAKLRGHPLEAQLFAGGGGTSFDHSAWAEVLSAAAHPDRGRMDYAAVSEDLLAAYLDQLAKVDLSTLPRSEQKALLINAYNAFTIRLIVQQPALPNSIRDLPDPWGSASWTLGGERVSLDDIEHALLRPVFRDPRLHFALNCASIGCPPLRSEPFVGDRLDTQLDTVTRDTLARSQWLSVEGDRLTVTPLLDWYGPDFTAEGWAPVASTKAEWLAMFGSPAVIEAVASGAGIRYSSYDWRLNDVHTPTN